MSIVRGEISRPSRGGTLTEAVIRTPDQRLRVFVSSTLAELSPERAAARAAIEQMHLIPVLFELGARPHPPQDLYRAYLAQSQVFVGLYWERYGWVGPGMSISGLEDEYRLAAEHPKLIYIKEPAPGRDAELGALLDRIRADAGESYRAFREPGELRELLEVDLAVMLTEHFEAPSAAIPASDDVTRLKLTSVPVAPAGIVGRDLEIASVSELLLRADVRMVTLLGTGGIGKTRLAVHLGELLASEFAQGVSFVDLTAVRDPTLVLSTIARSLGVGEAGTRTIAEALVQVLADSALLLVIDNFEQVQAAAPNLADLLAATTRLKLLVTSRAPLHLRWEHEFPLHPLALPQEGDEMGPLALAAVPAVEMFVDCARRVRPGFVLDESNAVDVAGIVRRLDGLPLALELAGARLRSFSAADVLGRLCSRLDLLEGGAADAPERQRTLRSSIAWSHDLLTDEERTLFRRISVFVGGASIDAVEEVCVGDPVSGDALIDLLSGLVDKSLLVSAADIAAGPTRFTMLESIREYGHEQLEDVGELDRMRGRHLEWALGLVEQTRQVIWSPNMASWLDLLALELDNLRAALDHAEASGDGDAAMRIAGELWPMWDIRGHLREGQRRLAGLVGCASGPDSPALAGALLSLGWVTALLGDFEAALGQMRRAVAIAHEVSEPSALAWALIMAGNVSFNMSLAEETRSSFEEALGIYPALDPETGRIIHGWALFGLAHVAILDGDVAEAARLLDESLVLGREAGIVWGNAWALFSRGVLQMLGGDIDGAVARINESLDGRWQVGDRRGTADCLTLLAGLASMRGQYERSARLHGAAALQREATGAQVLPWLADFHTQSLDAVRADLGDARTDALFAEGRTVPLEKVVAELLAAG